MRVIEEKMCKAIDNKEWFHLSNTDVHVYRKYYTNGSDRIDVYLFNNLIATFGEGEVHLTCAGWNTSTTRSRLNAICEYFFDDRPFHIKDWTMRYNGEVFPQRGITRKLGK